jgi:hypothetical protein
MHKSSSEFHTCTIGMIVKASMQNLLRKGIWFAPATSRSAFAATVVYSRILSAVVEELGGITVNEGEKATGGT